MKKQLLLFFVVIRFAHEANAMMFKRVQETLCVIKIIQRI